MQLAQLVITAATPVEYYEKEGFPFASVYLDSGQLNDDKISASLVADKGQLYHIDSPGEWCEYQQTVPSKYLYLPNGTAYNKDKISEVDKRILELPLP